jgi:hypothetical protein
MDMPDCGRQFVSVNRNHSRGRSSLEDHFAGKEPVSVFPVKTRKRWLDGYSWLKRRLRTRAFDAWKWGFTAIMGIFSA